MVVCLGVRILREIDEGESQDGEAHRNGARIEEEQGGEYVNMEVSFAYRARPSGAQASTKARNAHLLIHFYLGVKKLLDIDLPVYVELRGLVGTARVRLQIISDPPFVKHATLSFMGLPRVDFSAVPLNQHLVNVMRLPVISGFIDSSICAAMAQYCAPSSYTVDVQKMLLDDDIKRETTALGVILLRIHGAENLEKSDMRGSSDPYCTIEWSKQGKPLYSTRVIVDDLNPLWEESAAIIIRPELVRSQEDVQVTVWDSDRYTADDRLGKACFSLETLLRKPGKIYRNRTPLEGVKAGTSREGHLNWTVSFHPKADLRSELHTDGRDPFVDPDVRKKYEREFEMDEGHKKEIEDGGAVQRTRPDPEHPSGILSIQVHSIAQLELRDTERSYGTSQSRSGSRGQDPCDKETEEEDKAPSAYCDILLNDQTIYRTRSKPFSHAPFFNAGTERFITDWRTTMVMVVARDSRLRESDPILGVVPLKLSEIFKNSSQLTNSYPLTGGVGTGRIRLSILFRSVDLKLERPLLGWDVGTLQIHSEQIIAKDFQTEDRFSVETFGWNRLYLRTISSTRKLKARSATYSEDLTEVRWKVAVKEPPLRLPVKRRYASAFSIEFHTHTFSGTARAIAVIWLRDLSDNEMYRNLRLPIWTGDKEQFHRVQQEYTSGEEDVRKLGLKLVGYLEIDLRFKSGLGKTHGEFSDDKDAEEVMEAWECAVTSGLRSTVGDFINEYTDVDRNRDPLAYRRKQVCQDDDDESSSSRDVDGESDRDSDYGDEPDDSGAADESRSRSQPISRQEKRKALHQEQRGIYQFKPARSARWVASSLRRSIRKARGRVSLHNRGAGGEIETEA